MIERADHHDSAPNHSTALVLAFFFMGKASHRPGLSALLQPRFGCLRFLVFPKSKIAFEEEDIFERDSHTVPKLSQRHLTAD